jgi:hypothetical protein
MHPRRARSIRRNVAVCTAMRANRIVGAWNPLRERRLSTRGDMETESAAKR